MDFKGKKAVIIGAGKSGIAAAKLLDGQGAAVILYDDKKQDECELLKKLGEGGFSEVWLVEDTSVQLKLVLKVFLPSSELDESGEELFRKELLQAVEDARNGINVSGPFDTAEEAVASMLED